MLRPFTSFTLSKRLEALTKARLDACFLLKRNSCLFERGGLLLGYAQSLAIDFNFYLLTRPLLLIRRLLFTVYLTDSDVVYGTFHCHKLAR